MGESGGHLQDTKRRMERSSTEENDGDGEGSRRVSVELVVSAARHWTREGGRCRMREIGMNWMDGMDGCVDGWLWWWTRAVTSEANLRDKAAWHPG